MLMGEPEDIIVKATQDHIAAKSDDDDIAPPTKMAKSSSHAECNDAIAVTTNAASGSSAAELGSSKDHHIPEILQPLLTALNKTVRLYKEEAEAWVPGDVYDLEDTSTLDKPRFLLRNVFDRYAAASPTHGQPNQKNVVYKVIQGLVALFHSDMLCGPFDRIIKSSLKRQEEANSIYKSFCRGGKSLTRDTPSKYLDLLAIAWWQSKRVNANDAPSFENDQRYLTELGKLLQGNMRAPF